MVVGVADVETAIRAAMGGLVIARCAVIVKTKLVVEVDLQGPKVGNVGVVNGGRRGRRVDRESKGG